jgi:hypothetical protein
MERIIGLNSSVDTNGEHVISAGGSLTFPTAPCVHNIASNSAQDDWDGVRQVDTATAVGTIGGIKQVETATVAGTASSTVSIDVIVTGALVTGSPLTIPVSITNGDSANTVGGLIRAALNADIKVTTNYDVSGATNKVVLTAKVGAANDATLNINIQGAASGITTAATSANTTAGSVTSLTATVDVTAAGVTGSPVRLTVSVANGDTAATWAGKVRLAIAANAAISALYTTGGSGAAITLTAKTAAANDATLNISLDNGSCSGITTASTSADTTAGVAGTGAKSVRIWGMDNRGLIVSELVRLQGTTNVATTKQYAVINAMEVESVGSGGSNAGLITATATSGSTVSCGIVANANVSQYAVWGNGTNGTRTITSLNVICVNSGTADTTIDFIIRKKTGANITMFSATVADNGTYSNATPLPQIKPGETLILKATAASGTTNVAAYINLD